MEHESVNIFATVIFNSDGISASNEYARGNIGVAQSLRNVNTKALLYALVTPDVIPEDTAILEKIFDKVVVVPLITHQCVPMKSKKQNEIYGSWIHACFTKCNVLNPDYFPLGAKVILVDSDMFFMENCDSLFTLGAPAMTFSSPWAYPYLKPKGGRNPYFNKRELKHGEIVDPRMIERGFSGGILGLACMVLVEPSRAQFDTAMRLLDRNDLYGNSQCISGFDEQLFAETFLAMKTPIYHIHQQYNWIVGKHNWLLHGEKPKTQQFYNGKPWREVTSRDDIASSPWQDVREWWAIVDVFIEQFPETADWFFMAGGQKNNS